MARDVFAAVSQYGRKNRTQRMRRESERAIPSMMQRTELTSCGNGASVAILCCPVCRDGERRSHVLSPRHYGEPVRQEDAT